MTLSRPGNELVANVRHEGHETGAFDGPSYGILGDSSAAALAAADDSAMAIDELAEQFNVLVIDVHRTGPLAVDQNRILLFRSDLRFARAPFE